jgi:hypothetical protein
MRGSLLSGLAATALALAAGVCLLVSVRAQTPDEVDKMLANMPEEARTLLQAELKRQGFTLDDVRTNPQLAGRLLSDPSFQQRIREAMEAKARGGKASGPSSPKGEPGADRAAGTGPPGAPQKAPQASSVHASVPERYAVIAARNLFRPLGWGGEAKRNPFRLVGVVFRGNGDRRVLLAREGTPAGLYLGVGDDAGEGYRVTGIERQSARLAGGPLGEISLQLSNELVGSTGGGPPSVAAPKQAAAPPPQKQADTR